MPNVTVYSTINTIKQLVLSDRGGRRRGAAVAEERRSWNHVFPVGRLSDKWQPTMRLTRISRSVDCCPDARRRSLGRRPVQSLQLLRSHNLTYILRIVFRRGIRWRTAASGSRK